HLGARVILEFDDCEPNAPVYNDFRRSAPKDLLRRIRRSIEKADWLVVSTEPLLEEYKKYHDDIRVAHNRLPVDWWAQLENHRVVGRKPRIGWAGGSSHKGDLAVIRQLAKDLQEEVEWVFMGMRPEGIDCEFHAGVSIEQYPKKVASLNLDLAVVPLEINQFNRCKSNLRLLELGVLGVPIICTDIEPYRCGLPVELVSNRYQDWYNAITDHIADLEHTRKRGTELRQAILDDWMLEGAALEEWCHAWLGQR